jgi:hypothetical protein
MEMASVASNDAVVRSRSHIPIHPHPPQQASFATSNLMMGPPLTAAGPLCSALLLAANAACRPDSSIPFRSSFDASGDDKSAISDVVAHVDTVRVDWRLVLYSFPPPSFPGGSLFWFSGPDSKTAFLFSFHSTQDDCCDRSEVESEVSTLHSQDDMTSEHKEEVLNDSVMSSGEAGCSTGTLLHHASEPSLAPPNGRGGHRGTFPVVFARPRRLIFLRHSSNEIRRALVLVVPRPRIKRITTSKGFVVDICRKMERLIYTCRKMERSIHGNRSFSMIVEEKTTGAIGELDCLFVTRGGYMIRQYNPHVGCCNSFSENRSRSLSRSPSRSLSPSSR